MSQTHPTRQQVQDQARDLLRRAAEHPLGTDFVLNGALDSVSATFGVHAFVVDAARDTRQPPEMAMEVVTPGSKLTADS